ncbi:MAG TPA: RuBisCO large subunit C-terminal-like domain-containing protein [Acetobacteraceae bacterium]|nr:RuBisCO large subunit C-terminal-like domain-containing protein [Acetobacteraceae bacterium]
MGTADRTGGTDRLIATYLVRAQPAAIVARAQAIAVEQSVEMPLEAIDDRDILDRIVGRVEDIADRGGGLFAVRIGLAAATVGTDAGQLLNMAFGNTSLHEDVVLADLELPADSAARFGGPRHGLAGLRARVGAGRRALTCSAIKPQGLAPARLADIARRFALGGIDYVKDDHGLADQDDAPFAARIAACAEAVRRAAARTGHPTRYVPSLSGSLDDLRRQARQAREAGVDTVMLAPMLAGWSNVQALGREFPDLAVLAHPTMGGAARIAPELLLGRLFPLIGADAVIFPNYGGRFGYSKAACLRLAETARRPKHGHRACLPVPAGGMSLDRVPEMLDFYGPDVMLLIGGSLLAAGEHLTAETARFARDVAAHRYSER